MRQRTLKLAETGLRGERLVRGSSHGDLKDRQSAAGQELAHIQLGGIEESCAMPTAKDLRERARMFDERAELAVDPISRQHYREMAAHYRSLSIEHQEATPRPEHEEAH